MENNKRTNSPVQQQNLDQKTSANPLDQFSDLVYKTVDNMVEGDEEETKPQG